MTTIDETVSTDRLRAIRARAAKDPELAEVLYWAWSNGWHAGFADHADLGVSTPNPFRDL